MRLHRICGIVAITASVTLSPARPINDISLYIPTETFVLKQKSGSSEISLKFQTLATYYSDYIEPSKLKAEGTISYYLSNDSTFSVDDLFLGGKAIVLKDQKEKKLKAKFIITTSDLGRYIIAVTSSSQDFNGDTKWARQIPYIY